MAVSRYTGGNSGKSFVSWGSGSRDKGRLGKRLEWEFTSSLTPPPARILAFPLADYSFKVLGNRKRRTSIFICQTVAEKRRNQLTLWVDRPLICQRLVIYLILLYIWSYSQLYDGPNSQRDIQIGFSCWRSVFCLHNLHTAFRRENVWVRLGRVRLV